MVQELGSTFLSDLCRDPIRTSSLVVLKAPYGFLHFCHGRRFHHVFSDGTLGDVADNVWFGCAVTVEEFLEVLFQRCVDDSLSFTSSFPSFERRAFRPW